MKTIDVLVVGGGPAGLCAAVSASSLGANVLVCEQFETVGGQLVKQTHKFFGSEKQGAGERGFKISQRLDRLIKRTNNIELWTNSTILGFYEDGVLTCEKDGQHIKIKPGRVIIATGASERFLNFPGNDLPGVYGAGAVQTIMNVSGVIPAERVLMVGAGNIGLIVAYQLLQAGVKVECIIKTSPKIGGYLVHASKIRRLGIPIKTGYTITAAHGDGKVESATISQVDANRVPIPGTEEQIECDAICLAVGLSPLTELCWQAGCEMAYVSELSGYVPVRDQYLQTTVPSVYVAGDATGVEEASSAMVEGHLAGISAALSLGMGSEQGQAMQQRSIAELQMLRSGDTAAKYRKGLEKLAEIGGVINGIN